MKISLSMSYDKKKAEEKVTSFSRVLFKHSLKFLAHNTSMIGEYGYWQDEMITIVSNIRDFALNVKTPKGTLSKALVLKLLVHDWNTNLIASCNNVWETPQYLTMKKFDSSKEDFYNRVDSLKGNILAALKELVNNIYNPDLSDYYCSHIFFEMIRKSNDR